MRSYHIYLIEEEFAQHYFGREKIFLNLFMEYTRSSGGQRRILQKQIDYITRPIPVLKIQQSINDYLFYKEDVSYKDGVYYIQKNSGNSRAALQINKEHLILQAEGEYDAETAFFESIRKCETSFLAFDIKNQRCGWLKPIKERKFV
ncbi:sporulation inhibitor of replication protein SirA [Peribacillus sp. SCS-155]|uniref:sporulation inhibitor of replication protein SirA n=1 Tax=Peribacillus sedimenti TaxID=3115297 RepID=UPI003906CC12